MSSSYNPDDYEVTFGNFLKNRVTDTFNLLLSHILFWVFGFRTIYMCGYTTIFTMSHWFCKNRVEFLDLAKDVETTQPYNKGLYEACEHAADVSSTPYGSLNEHGGFCRLEPAETFYIVTPTPTYKHLVELLKYPALC